MRISLVTVLSLVAFTGGAAAAQSAGVPAGSTAKTRPPITFSYDAQHENITASGLPVLPLVAPGNTTPLTGTVTVVLHINTVSKFGNHTSIRCSAAAIGGILDQDNQVVAGGFETANGSAWGGTCTLKIPYSWNLPADPAADRGLVIAFGASAVSGEGSNQHVARSSLQVDGIEDLPADGSTTTFTFNVTL